MTELSHDIQVRWSDLDGLGHVNHSTVLAYLEVGRDAALHTLGIEPDQYVVRQCDVNYLHELRPAESGVEYRCDGLIPGRTSIRTRERLLDAQGRNAVEAQFTLVMWDAALRGSRPLTSDERRNLSSLSYEESMK